MFNFVALYKSLSKDDSLAAVGFSAQSSFCKDLVTVLYPFGGALSQVFLQCP